MVIFSDNPIALSGAPVQEKLQRKLTVSRPPVRYTLWVFNLPKGCICMDRVAFLKSLAFMSAEN
jgi:hypothetical protein